MPARNDNTSALTGVATTPEIIKPMNDGPNWAAIAALAISIFTLLKTLYGDLRASKAKRLAKFETDFGTPIRIGLRDYEKTVKTIRVFALASNKTTDELKVEIEKYRTTWIDGAYDVSRLLAEADSSDWLETGNWSRSWTEKTDVAEELMINMTEAANLSPQVISDYAKRALTEVETAIAEARRSLRDEAARY